MTGNTSIEHRRTVHGGDDSALSVEVSAVRFVDGGGGFVETVNADVADATGFGVYIRNPLAFHIQDFGPESVDPERRVTIDEAKAAAFQYADRLAEHLGCTVETQLQRRDLAAERAATYRATMQAEGVRLLRANGFSEETGGGGCTIWARNLPNGAYIWATNEEGPGEPWAREFCVCVYACDVDKQTSEPLLDLRFNREGPFLLDAIRMAAKAAEAVDAAIAGGGFYLEPSLRDVAEEAADSVREATEIVPEGFRRWSDGIAQGFAVLQREDGGGCIILSDMFGQTEATAESWEVSVFSGRFDFENEHDSDTISPVHRFTMESGLTLDAALQAAGALLKALPGEPCDNHLPDGRGLCRTCREPM